MKTRVFLKYFVHGYRYKVSFYLGRMKLAWKDSNLQSYLVADRVCSINKPFQKKFLVLYNEKIYLFHK